MKKIPITLQKEPDFVIEESTETVSISGTTFVMPDFEIFTKPRDLVIKAFDVTLTENIIAPSRKVTIVCKRLRIPHSLRISVDGSDAPSHNLPADDGYQIAEKGKDGAEGNSGDDAGAITIVAEEILGQKLSLSASGGSGSQGQKGGTGAQGQRGKDGSDGPGKPYGGKGHTGGQGGKGGTAGAGGKGGDGGAGGQIVVVTETSTDELKVDASTDGGNYGLPGDAGGRGPGGIGGQGGWNISCFEVDTEHGGYTVCKKTSRAAKGPDGPLGDEPDPNIPGQLGHPGSFKVEPGVANATAKHLDISVLRMILHEAELHYLNNRLVESATCLTWILQITESPNGIGQELSNVSEEVDEGVSGRHLSSIRRRAKVLIIQITQGLDYYGYIPKFVSLTSIDLYKKIIHRVLQLAGEVESAYKEYHEDLQGGNIARNALATAVGILEVKIKTGEAQISQIGIEISDTGQKIAELLREIEELRISLESAEDAFIQAVEREAACGLEEVLSAASALAGIGSGLGAIVSGVSGLMLIDEFTDENKLFEGKKFTDFLKDIKKLGKYSVKEFKEVGGGLDDIKNGYSTIKSLLEQERDGAKLIVGSEDGASQEFEETMKRFEHLEEAREYRRLMRRFVQLNEVRNLAIIQVDVLRTRVSEIETEQEQLSLEVDATKATMTKYFNPRLVEHVVFFERAISRLRAEILRALVMEFRALQYWSLQPSALPGGLQDRTVAHLKAIQLNFELEHLREIERRNSEPSRFESISGFSVSRSEDADLFSALETSKQLSFQIVPFEGDFSFFTKVLVERAHISLRYRQIDGVDPGRRAVYLTHHGDPRFTDETGAEHFFRHSPRVRNSLFDSGDHRVELTLGGLHGKYAFLSPFATWTLMFRKSASAAELRLDDIDAIEILFDGVGFAYAGIV